MIYRFADFNAGRYASRNAAFQNAVSVATGQALDLDGDLLLPGNDAGGRGQHRTRGAHSGREAGPHRARDPCRSGARRRRDFDRSEVYAKVFALADKRSGRALARAVLPRIQLDSPKITRTLTTEWFAKRVDERYQRCLAR